MFGDKRVLFKIMGGKYLKTTQFLVILPSNSRKIGANIRRLIFHKPEQHLNHTKSHLDESEKKKKEFTEKSRVWVKFFSNIGNVYSSFLQDDFRMYLNEK